MLHRMRTLPALLQQCFLALCSSTYVDTLMFGTLVYINIIRNTVVSLLCCVVLFIHNGCEILMSLIGRRWENALIHIQCASLNKITLNIKLTVKQFRIIRYWYINLNCTTVWPEILVHGEFIFWRIGDFHTTKL